MIETMSLPVGVAIFIYVTVMASLGFLPVRRGTMLFIVRKSVHLGTGIALFLLTYWIDRNAILVLLLAGTLFAFLSYRVKRLNVIHLSSPGSYGTLFYPVGLVAAFLVLGDLPIEYFRVSLLLLSVSDTVASFGTFLRRGNPRFALPAEEKSLWGSAGFAAATFLISRMLLPHPIGNDIPYLAVLAVVAVNLEIFSFRGSDNLTIPLGAALFLRMTTVGLTRPVDIIGIIGFVGIGSMLVYRLGFLTKLGSMAVYGLGLYYFAVLGLPWLIPVAAFFLTSVVFTKINSRVYRKISESERRNIWQVCANIAVATAASGIFLAVGRSFWHHAFIAAVAAVTADTWASEIGPVVHRQSFSLADRKLRKSGISGGISPAGTLAALAGSFCISWFALSLFQGPTESGLIIILTVSGFLASLVDSVLGAFIEPRLEKWAVFRNSQGTDKISPNDVVNFTASLSAPVFFWLLRFPFG